MKRETSDLKQVKLNEVSVQNAQILAKNMAKWVLPLDEKNAFRDFQSLAVWATKS